MSDLGLHLHVRRLPAYRVFWMFWGGLALLDALAATPALTRFAAVALLAAACARRATLATALAVAATGWLLVNGFVDNSFGRLDLHGTPDLLQAVVLLAVSVVAARR